MILTEWRRPEFLWSVLQSCMEQSRARGRCFYLWFLWWISGPVQWKADELFGTPTATSCMADRKYPEVLNARKDGVLLRHGGRRHYNYNSPVYQRLCAELWREAAHYAKHPAIVGWQIDNEINCEVNEFYSEAGILLRFVISQKTVWNPGEIKWSMGNYLLESDLYSMESDLCSAPGFKSGINPLPASGLYQIYFRECPSFL